MTNHQREYYKEYNKKALRRISLALNKERDRDIIDAIEKAGNGNAQAGIKAIIRSTLK